MGAQIKIGSLTISVAATDTKQIFKDVSFWTQDFPHVCGMCKGTNIAPAHRVAQGYDFYSAKCLDCGGEYAFGQAKEGGHLFPKKEWKPAYSGGNQQSTSQRTEELDDVDF